MRRKALLVQRLSALMLGALIGCIVSPVPGFAADPATPAAAKAKTKAPPKHAAAKPAAARPAPPQPAAAPAAPAETPHDQGTLDVTSSSDLEWLQQDHAYIARGNAVAKRGTVTLMGDTLIAYYRPIAGAPPRPKPAGASTSPDLGFDSGTTEIWRVVAEGNVHIISEDRDAWGDRAEYDKDKAVVVLTGKALKATTLEDMVFARDSLEYWQDQDMAVARGNARILKVNGNALAGDVIGGHFVKDNHGTSVLKTIESRGNVVVTTPSDIVHGDEGVYDLDTKRTVLFGNVRATHGSSTIEGASAEVNMDTGISQVFPALGQRVHGLFVRQSVEQGPETTTSGKR